MNLHKVTIHLSDSAFAVALRRAGTIGVERFLDHLVADSLLHETSFKKSNVTKITTDNNLPNGEAFPTDEVLKTILQIHTVVQHVHDEGMNFRKAVKMTANEFGVNESTVRDKCTRRISDDVNKINTEKFEELLKTPQELVKLLCERFPDHRQAILEKFKI